MPVTPLPQPVYPPSSGTRFGASRSATGRPAECGGGHCGVDLYLPIGTPVRSVAAGKVVAASSSSSAGNFVWIQHGSTWRSHYVHLDSYNVSTGQQLGEGQQIGTLGRTGIQNDPAHLHFALSRNVSGAWKYYDPEPSLRAWAAAGGGLFGLAVIGGLAWWLIKRS